MSDAPSKLGEILREGLGEGPGEAQLQAQRRRTLDAMSRRSPAPRSASWPLGLGVAALATAVVAIWLSVAPSSDTLRCHDAHGDEIEAGEWVSASASANQLDFTDASTSSTLHMDEGARLRLEQLEASHVRVLLEEGRIDSDVRSPHGTVQWVFLAGPFEVEVLGTRLSIDWQPAPGRVVVAVEHGVVRVRRGREDDGVSVHAGERFEASVSGGFELTTASAPTVEEVVEAREETVALDAVDREEAVIPSVEPRTPTRSSAPRRAEPEDWTRIAHEGDYPRAFAAAQREGLTHITAHAEAADVLLLADTARFAGGPDDARTILVALRARFPGTPHASMAAFRLGRLAFDQGRYDEAVELFETYRREAPHGRLVEQAHGRELEALTRTGDDARAAQVARAYLAAHPDGPYRALALSALGEQSP